MTEAKRASNARHAAKLIQLPLRPDAAEAAKINNGASNWWEKFWREADDEPGKPSAGSISGVWKENTAMGALQAPAWQQTAPQKKMEDTRTRFYVQVRAPDRTVSEQWQLYSTAAAKSQQLQQQLEEITHRRIELDESPMAGPADEMQRIPSLEASAAVSPLEAFQQAAQKKQALDQQETLVKKAYEETSQQLEQYDKELHAIVARLPVEEQLEIWLEPGYRLDETEKEMARRIGKEGRKRAAQEYAELMAQGVDPFSKEGLAKQQESVLYDQLLNKTSAAGAFADNAADALPFFTHALDLAAEAQRGLYGLDESTYPLTGFQDILTQQLPVLGHLASADAVAGILGDQALDTAFDTIPSLYEDIRTYQTQGEDGTLTIPGIVGRTVGNVGVNLGMNLLGEEVQGLLQSRTARNALEERAMLERNHLLDLDEPVPMLEMPKEAVATPAETALRQEAQLPILEAGNTFKAISGGAGDAELKRLVDAYQSGSLTNAQMETLKPGGAARQAFEEATGLRLPATSSGTRTMLRRTAQMAGPDNVERFAREVDEVFGGKRTLNKTIVLGNTPKIYLEYGAVPHDVTIQPMTLYKIAYPEGYFNGRHNLGIPAVKALPEQIQNPVAILRSKSQKDSFVILTEWADQSGNPVVIPLHLNRQGALTLENRIPSAYGKENVASLAGEAGENVLWTKGNEDITTLLSHRLQLPQAVADDTLVSNYSIPRSASNVNLAGVPKNGSAGPQGLDSGGMKGYAETIGGAEYGKADLGASIGGTEPGGTFGSAGSLRPGGDAGGNQRVFRQPVTNPEDYARAGATVQPLDDTTAYPEAFCQALDEAIQTNKYGLMVSAKTPQELADSEAITFMSKDGLCGAAVTADGDIEAVFRIPGGKGKRLSYQMVVTAIDNGGVKLDCYGEDLVKNYARMGFEPVAKVKWDPEYAPEGWTYGPKDVYVMKLGDGLTAEDVAKRLGLLEENGGFHYFTDQELNALPVMEYDEALKYRDSLIGGVQSTAAGTQKSLAELDLDTADWNEILNSPEIRQARELAKFDTPTIAINTPERQALRQQIADELMELGSYSGKDAAGNELFTGPVRRERRADIVIGPPAAGKSSVLANPLSQQYGSRIIDSDMAKAKLPEFNGGIGAGRVHLESAQITETDIFKRAVLEGDNIVIPWVGKSPEKLRNALEQLKAEGYSVHLSLNELDPDKAARRAIERFKTTGRLVDPEYVLDVGWKPSEAYDILKTEGGFDSYVKYSNDVPYGQPAKLLERSELVEEVQTGGMGRSGRGLGPGNLDGAFKDQSTAPAGSTEVSSQGDPAAFSIPKAQGSIPALRQEAVALSASPAGKFAGEMEPNGDKLRGGEATQAPVGPVTAHSGFAAGEMEPNGDKLPVLGEPEIPAGLRERGYAESLRTKSDLPDVVKNEFVNQPEVYRQLSNAETAAGTQKSLAELDLDTADWNEILNSPEIRQARELAKFDTPTIAINTPERQALRQQIADELMELGSYSGKDAAGKSFVLANPLSQQYGSRIIDSDMAKAKLPEFNGSLGANRV